MPKNILKIPLKNLGLLNNTTFINTLRQQRALEQPRIITQIASTPTNNLGGQKQLIKSPPAKAIAVKPLLNLLCLRILFPPYNNIILRKIKKVTIFCFYPLPKALNLSFLQIIEYMNYVG